MKDSDNRIILKDNKMMVDAFEIDEDNKKDISKSTYKLCMFANYIYIFFHIAYSIFFLATGLYLMLYINLGSLAIYSLAFILIKKRKLPYYVLVCGVEITSYMTAGTMIVGFNAGFHLCLIGQSIIAFFASYYSKRLGDGIKPIPWSIFMLCVYIFLYFWCLNMPAYYHNGEVTTLITSLLFVAHIVVVFGFNGLFMWYFVKAAVNLEKKILRDSKTDKLTQVGNRKALEDYITYLDMDKNRYTLTIFDIDDFKIINDKFGHLCGDFILRQIADLSLLNKQEDDFVVRFGGEEFVIISRIDESYDKTCDIIDDFRRLIQAHDFVYNDIDIRITVTLGISEYKKGMTLDEWVRASDIKLYQGKGQGKNKLVR